MKNKFILLSIFLFLWSVSSQLVAEPDDVLKIVGIKTNGANNSIAQLELQYLEEVWDNSVEDAGTFPSLVIANNGNPIQRNDISLSGNGKQQIINVEPLIRNNRGDADIVIVFTPSLLDDNGNEACGRAIQDNWTAENQMDGEFIYTLPDQLDMRGQNAFYVALVSTNCAINAVGTAAHEFAHLLGVAHEKDYANYPLKPGVTYAGLAPNTNASARVWPRFKGPGYFGFQTVTARMEPTVCFFAYAGPCPVIPYYADDLFFTGNWDADAMSAVRTTAFSVANYRPLPTPATPCGEPLNEVGGHEGFTGSYDLGTEPGVVTVEFDAYYIPDGYTVRADNSSNTLLLSSNGLASGFFSETFDFDADVLGTTEVNVSIQGNSDQRTAWAFTASCPGETLNNGNRAQPRKRVDFTFLKASFTSIACTFGVYVDGQWLGQVNTWGGGFVRDLSVGTHSISYTNVSCNNPGPLGNYNYIANYKVDFGPPQNLPHPISTNNTVNFSVD